MIAVQNGHTGIAQLLIEKGGNIEAKNKDQWTALIFASQMAHFDTVELLLANDANIGINALMMAAMNGHTNTVRLLLENGANILWSGAVLIAASLNGHTETVQLLLKKDANINAQNKQGVTALIIASQMGHFDTVELLLCLLYTSPSPRD